MPPPPPRLTATPSATIRLGAPHPYLKTHGTKVARLHLFDWLVLVLLAIIDVVLNLIQPFYRFVGEDMMTSLRYPMKDNTVPVWAVPVPYQQPFTFFPAKRIPKFVSSTERLNYSLFVLNCSDIRRRRAHHHLHCNIPEEEERV